MPKRTQEEFKSPYHASTEFTAAWDKWKAYRFAAHKFKYTSIFSEQEAANNLYKLSKGNVNWALDIISTAIERQWKGFFQSDSYSKTSGGYNNPAPEVYHSTNNTTNTAKPDRVTPPPPEPPVPISDREMALEQFKAFKDGLLKPTYIYPKLYSYFFNLGLITIPTGEPLASLMRRAKLLRTNQLSLAAKSKAELKYLEKVITDFGNDIINKEEGPYVRGWARKVAVQDLFTRLRDTDIEIEAAIDNPEIIHK